MEYRYVRSDINGISVGISIWNMGYRYGIWYINIMGDDDIDMIISCIDMGYLVTLAGAAESRPGGSCEDTTAHGACALNLT